MAAENVLELTSDNWEQEVEKSDVPVVVDFWATWCGPCRLLNPVMDSLATKLEGRAKVGKVNIDDAQDLAVRFGVSGIPRVWIFKGGEAVEKLAGVPSEAEITKSVENLLGA
ncbi:MAG: thioredoxin [Gemmataceae bacterium]